jgi:hypothetical protein
MTVEGVGHKIAGYCQKIRAAHAERHLCEGPEEAARSMKKRATHGQN